MIIGCDFHKRYQQIAMMDEATGELVERRLEHESGEAHAFYRELQGPVRVGMEATGPIRWFERRVPHPRAAKVGVGIPDGWPGPWFPRNVTSLANNTAHSGQLRFKIPGVWVPRP